MATETKQYVGASAEKSETHVRLNSGHLMPLFGWGTAECDGDIVAGTKSAINLGYRVSPKKDCRPPPVLQLLRT